MLRWLTGRLKPSKPSECSDGETDAKPRHLNCPRCRRLLIVPRVEAFRCECSMIFRVSAMDNDQMQLSFSLADQEQNAQGCGLPRKLVERMPVTLVTEEMCAVTKATASEETEEAKEGAEKDTMTCRICLSNYKAGESLRVLPCFHKFHVDEIDGWLDRNMTCPLCHLDVNEALTGSSGVAFISAEEGNPSSFIGRVRQKKRR